MTQQTTPHGRPLPAAIALGFIGTAFTGLLLRELLLLYCGQEPALGLALAVPAALLLPGAALARRRAARHDPADMLGEILGVLALVMPVTLLVLRAARPLCGIQEGAFPSILSIFAAAGLAFALLGLCLGFGLWTVFATAARHPKWSADKTTLPLALTGFAAAGALFVQFVVVPYLTPLNACLDMAIGCAAAGLLCTIGTPGGRHLETRLSLLAVCCVLALPISNLVDAKSRQWEWGHAISLDFVAVQGPQLSQLADGVGRHLGLGAASLALALLLIFVTARRQRTPLPAQAAAMAESASALVVLFGYQMLGGSLYTHLAVLIAAFMAGETLGFFVAPHVTRRMRQRSMALPLVGPILGLAGLAAVFWMPTPSASYAPLAPALALSLGAGGLGGLSRAAADAAPSPVATAIGLVAVSVLML